MPTKTRRRNIETQASDLWPNKLADVRRTSGLTQEELANKVSQLGKNRVGQTTIAAIETGRTSGRHQMNRIAEALNVDPLDIFPYANLLSLSEASRAFGLTPQQIQRSGVPVITIKRTKFVLPEDAMRVALPRPRGASIHQQMREALDEYGPCTVSELCDILGPYRTMEDKIRRKNTIMVTLSRSPEFVADKSTNPAMWSYKRRRFVRGQRG